MLYIASTLPLRQPLSPIDIIAMLPAHSFTSILTSQRSSIGSLYILRVPRHLARCYVICYVVFLLFSVVLSSSCYLARNTTRPQKVITMLTPPQVASVTPTATLKWWHRPSPRREHVFTNVGFGV